MARCCLSKTGEYSAAHVISMGRVEKRPIRPNVYRRLPKEGDIIIYNIKSPFGDRRTALKKEQRGCIKVTKIYPSIITGVSYQLLPGSKQEIAVKITLPINDFRCGNVIYIKASKTVYCNTYQYEDWKLEEADNKEDMISRLHPYLRELAQEI